MRKIVSLAISMVYINNNFALNARGLTCPDPSRFVLTAHERDLVLQKVKTNNDALYRQFRCTYIKIGARRDIKIAAVTIGENIIRNTGIWHKETGRNGEEWYLSTEYPDIKVYSVNITDIRAPGVSYPPSLCPASPYFYCFPE